MSRGRSLISHAVGPPVLTRWGITVHADLVYRALTMQGRQSAVELARSLDLRAGQIRGALDELHGFGIAQAVGDASRVDDREWLGHPPESVVATLRGQQETLVTARRKLHGQLAALESVEVTAAELRAARPIATGSAVCQRAELLGAQCREYLVTDPEWAATLGDAVAGGATVRSLLRPGVTRLILGVRAATTEERKPRRAEVGAYGLRYRELPSLPITLMIMDRTTALVPFEPGSGFSGGAWEFSSASVVQQLVTFFMHHWHKASAPCRRWISPMQLTDRERAIIALLATGDTDATVAVTLGLSVRTIAYTVKELMERNGVRSRFQLGLMLGAENQREPWDR